MERNYKNGILHVISGGWLATLICEGIAATFIFISARRVQASPMVEPLNHPDFAALGPNIVAGHAAQSVIHALHLVQGAYAVGLIICLALMWQDRRRVTDRKFSRIEVVKYLAGFCAITHFIYLSLYLSPKLSVQWSRMYSLDLHSAARASSRELFNGLHL